MAGYLQEASLLQKLADVGDDLGSAHTHTHALPWCGSAPNLPGSEGGPDVVVDDQIQVPLAEPNLV